MPPPSDEREGPLPAPEEDPVSPTLRQQEVASRPAGGQIPAAASAQEPGKAIGARPGTCPVCGARFRGHGACSRCGADLLPLMAVIVRSFRLRLQAREALLSGHASEAAHLAREAQATCATGGGAAILDVAEWIASVPRPL